MYIYPNTTVKILHNVSLNNDYDHTIYFGSESAQRTFFDNPLRVKYTLNNQQYQRKERGWMQVNLNQNQLWDCTYLMFQNTHYTLAPSQSQGTSYKWFYAFILNVEYVNENVSRINFEIDEMQTWMFDYVLDKCFVEREHSTSDNMFENIVEEDVDIGTDLSVQLFRRYNLSPSKVMVIYTSLVVPDHPSDPDTKYHLESATPRKIGDYFTGIGMRYFDLNSSAPDYGLNAFGDFLHLYIDNGFEDAILSIYQYPSFIMNAYTDEYSTDTWSLTPNLTNVDGYVPKNKKLFIYPYNFLKLSNNKGEDVIYKNEMWNNPSLIGVFELSGVSVGIPSVMCYPLNYRDISRDYENGLMYTGFNECAWAGDAYQIWLAQNRKNNELGAKIAAGALLVGAGLAIGGATAGALPMVTLPQSVPMEIGAGNLLGPAMGNVATKMAVGGGSTQIGGSMIKYGASGLVGLITRKIAAKNKLEATPRPAHGHINNDIFNMQMGLCGYTCYQMTIKKEYAKIIDEYFSRFGYACKRIKVPNRNARINWTYTKTIGCEISGNLPSDSIAKIKSIYDSGITFWNDGMNIGNYGDFTNPTY